MDDLVHQQELLVLSSLLQGNKSEVCQHGCDSWPLPVVTSDPSRCSALYLLLGLLMLQSGVPDFGGVFHEGTHQWHISCLLQGLRAALQVPTQEALPCIGLLCIRWDVVCPAEVFRDGYSQIIACVYPVQDGVVQLVEVAEGIGATCKCHDITLLRIEMHSPDLAPVLQCVQVSLHLYLVFDGMDGTVDQAIVCKQVTLGSRVKDRWQVVDK